MPKKPHSGSVFPSDWASRQVTRCPIAGDPGPSRRQQEGGGVHGLRLDEPEADLRIETRLGRAQDKRHCRGKWKVGEAKSATITHDEKALEAFEYDVAIELHRKETGCVFACAFRRLGSWGIGTRPIQSKSGCLFVVWGK